MTLGEDFGALVCGEQHFFIKALHGSFFFHSLVSPLSINSHLVCSGCLVGSTVENPSSSEASERDTMANLRSLSSLLTKVDSSLRKRRLRIRLKEGRWNNRRPFWRIFREQKIQRQMVNYHSKTSLQIWSQCCNSSTSAI